MEKARWVPLNQELRFSNACDSFRAILQQAFRRHYIAYEHSIQLLWHGAYYRYLPDRAFPFRAARRLVS